MQPQMLAPGAGEARRYDLDWLRVIATLLIFVYHSTRPFDTFENWHVKHVRLSDAFTFMVVGAVWLMPLFFILAGAGSFFALRARGAGPFVRARFLRLAVPLMTVGWWVLGPIQVYLERASGTGYNTAPFHGSFLAFLPHYLEGIYGDGGNFALQGVHLWFLYWLFLFSLITLPLFQYLLGDRGRRLLAGLGRLAAAPGGIFLLVLPLALVEALTQLGVGPDNEEGGWYLATYLVLLVYGFVIVAEPRLDRAIVRHRWAALGLTALLAAALLTTGLPGASGRWGRAGPALDVSALAAGGWFGLVAILGFGRRHLDFVHPALIYAGQAVLPFYILHQPAIVVVGYLARGWDAPVGLVYLVSTAAAFAATLLTYELLVRRLNPLRFLFGMKPLPRGRAVVRTATGA